MEKSCLYCQKEFNGRIDKKYCSSTCKKYYNRWIRGIQKTPFKSDLKDNAKFLLKISNNVQDLYYSGNSVAEKVIKAIELRHFDIIHRNDKEYLLKKYISDPLTKEEINEILDELTF